MTRIVFCCKIHPLATNVCGIPFAYWSYQTIALKCNLKIDPRCVSTLPCLHPHTLTHKCRLINMGRDQVFPGGQQLFE